MSSLGPEDTDIEWSVAVEVAADVESRNLGDLGHNSHSNQHWAAPSTQSCMCGMNHLAVSNRKSMYCLCNQHVHG